MCYVLVFFKLIDFFGGLSPTRDHRHVKTTFYYFSKKLFFVRCFEGLNSKKNCKQQYSTCPHISSWALIFHFRANLRTHIGRGSTKYFHFLTTLCCKSKIYHFCDTIWRIQVHQYVFWFYVPMSNVLPVIKVHSFHNLIENFWALIFCQVSVWLFFQYRL